MANTDRARKLFIRSVLATGATIATFVGAQNLAMLDRQAGPDAPASVTAAMPATIEPLIRRAAPAIIVLRPADSTAAQRPSSSLRQIAIAPPVPVAAGPAPAIVPQPVRQSSRSTR